MSDFAFQLLLTLDATLRLATPLIFCAIAGLFSERSGIIDISLEGKLLGSAFAAAATASLTGSVYMGLLAAVGTSVLMALLHGFASITLRGSPSWVEANTSAVEPRIKAGMSRRKPRKCVREATPVDSASCFKSSSNGPSPARTSRAFLSASVAKARIISACRLRGINSATTSK